MQLDRSIRMLPGGTVRLPRPELPRAGIPEIVAADLGPVSVPLSGRGDGGDSHGPESRKQAGSEMGEQRGRGDRKAADAEKGGFGASRGD